jgi:hypothetical protein
MVKNFINFKTLSVILSIGAMASIASIQNDSKGTVINLSAINTAINNVKYLSVSNENKIIKSEDSNPFVTDSIIKTIEKDLKSQVKKERLIIAKANEKIQYAKEIRKNWNDIKPELLSTEKKESIALSILKNNFEENILEINNKELVMLYGINVETMALTKFENLKIESEKVTEVEKIEPDNKVTQVEYSDKAIVENKKSPNDDLDLATDEVSTQQSSDETKIENDEDLVVYDYPVKNEDSKKMFNQPISNSVKEAIEREVNKDIVKPELLHSPSRKLGLKKIATENIKFDESSINNESAVKFEYSNHETEKEKKVEDNNSITSALAASFAPSNEGLNTQVEFKIKAIEVNMNTQKTNQAVGFEFVPDYDRANRQDDLANGEIELAYSLTNKMNTQTGIIQSQGNIPTRVELNLNEGEITVPLISEVGIQKYLEKSNMNIVGNLVLVSIDNTILDVEIDSEYQLKILLNQKFAKVSKKEDATYVMLLGVKTGNSLLRYMLSNNETAQKIIFVGDGELYYEDPSFRAPSREIYNLTTRSLLGKKIKELNIPEDKISFYGSKNLTKKRAINSYEIKSPTTVENTRKYFEFKHLNKNLYVGSSNENNIEVPGNDFISKVLEVSDLKDLGQRCMVQINLSKEVRDVKVSGKNTSGEMLIENSFLDNDGNFNSDSSEMAEKIFASGDQEGIMSARVEYSDGSIDFLKTFCSEGSYIVEQL